jgi:hypothetical protein
VAEGLREALIDYQKLYDQIMEPDSIDYKNAAATLASFQYDK